MGILYNRFTQESRTWTLIKTFTEVNTKLPIDTTGKSELLVVCDDIVSVFIHCGITYSNSRITGRRKIYNTNTGTGYGYAVNYLNYDSSLQGPSIKVEVVSYPSVSGQTYPSSANVKVYAR